MPFVPVLFIVRVKVVSLRIIGPYIVLIELLLLLNFDFFQFALGMLF